MKIVAFIVVVVSTLGMARYTLDLNELVLKKLSWVDLRVDNAIKFVSSVGAADISRRLGRFCFLISGLVLLVLFAAAIVDLIIGGSKVYDVWGTSISGVFLSFLLAGIIFSAVQWSRQVIWFAVFAPLIAPVMTGCEMVRESLTGKNRLEMERGIAHGIFFWLYDNIPLLNNKWVEGAFLILVSPILWWAVLAVLLIIGLVFVLFSLMITYSLARICAAIRWTTPSRPLTIVFAVLFVLSTAYLTFENELTH